MIRSAALLTIMAIPAIAFAGDHTPPHTGADAAPVRFTVRVENISSGAVLKLRDGKSAPFVVAPGLWLVHSGEGHIFTPNAKAGTMGLEALAEDGNPSMLAESLKAHTGVENVGVYNTPSGANAPGPLTPGGVYEFTFEATPGSRLSLAEMFGQSNDLFYATGASGIELFSKKGEPVRGDITRNVTLWDAGTEVNEEPGSGINQAPRQAGPNTGPDENGVVRPVKDGFSYPRTERVLRITITPAQ